MAKKLLNEATIRRFQSLANISPINEMSYKEEKEEKMEEGVYEAEDDDKKKMEEVEHGDKDKEKMEETVEETYAMEQDDDPADDEGDMGDMGEEMDVDLTEEEAQVLIELGKKLEMAMGDMEPDMDGMDAMGADGMDDMDPMEEEVDLEESLEGINYIPSQTEVVNEVARRVARRLAEAQKAQKAMNEALGRK